MTTELVIVVAASLCTSMAISSIGVWLIAKMRKGHKQFMDDMDAIENGTYEEPR